MRVLIAPDKFKGSLTAAEVAAGMRAGVLAAMPGAQVAVRPIADGGDGFLDAVVAARGARLIDVEIHDALGRPRTARIALDGEACYIEAAEAVGITQTRPSPETAVLADTAGVGEMVLAGLDAGATSITIGLGGTSSTDGGTGMLRALGAVFLDSDGVALRPGAVDLSRLDRIELRLDPRVLACRFTAAHDVTTPLLGPGGAAAVFGPQKGADEQTVQELDAALARLAEVLRHQHGLDLAAVTGAGAAGGLGAALGGVLNAEMLSGASLVFALTGLEDELGRSDLVLTGEGSFDDQSLDGKGPFAVVQAAAAAGLPSVVIAGRATIPATDSRLPAVAAVAGLSDSFADPFTETARKLTELTTTVMKGLERSQVFAHSKPRL